MKVFINFKLLIPALAILIRVLFAHAKKKIYKKFRYKLNNKLCLFDKKVKFFEFSTLNNN